MNCFWLIIVVLILLCFRTPLYETLVGEPTTGTFSGVFIHEGEGYIVAAKNSSDSLPATSRFFTSPVLGTDVYQVVSAVSNRHARFINYVGDNFIAAPIRLRGSDPLDTQTINNIINTNGQKINGTWTYVGDATDTVTVNLLQKDQAWEQAQANYLYDVLDQKMPITSLPLV